MNDAQEQLRDAARKLFDEKKIDALIGFERGSLPRRSRPCIIRRAEDAGRLIWDDTCSYNLAAYLPEIFKKKPAPRGQPPPPPPRIAIVVKGCDALSVAGLIREKQIPRANLLVIAMPCRGIADPDTGETVPSCLTCRHPVAEDADIRIPGESRAPAEAEYDEVAAFEKKPVEERWAYFVEQMSKCIRCYACREVCPNCYCEECFAEKTNPRWIGVGNEISDTMLYHLGRMFHQAGRCVGCDACARACPMGVDLRAFTRKLAKDARELFDFEAGFDKEEGSLLSTFKDTDSDSFITDPEKPKSEK